MWYSTQQSVAVGSWRGQRITGGPRLAVAMDTVSSESAGTVGSGVAQSQSLSVDAAASSGQSSDADAYDTLYALDSFVGPSTLSVGARSSPGADALYADDSFEEFDVPESRSRTSSLCVEPADSDTDHATVLLGPAADVAEAHRTHLEQHVVRELLVR